MPTGYTAAVCDGKVTDFKEFALQCAHAFGALVALREERMDSPIPEFKPSSYNSEALTNEQAELARVKAMSLGECASEAMSDYRKALDDHQKRVDKATAIRERLLAMRSRVFDWTPPTSEHQGLKDFMIQQLDETISFDGKAGTYYIEQARKIGGAEWRESRIAALTKSITYHAEEHKKEVERVNGQNRWVSELRRSLA